jgi:hypothetical protein
MYALPRVALDTQEEGMQEVRVTIPEGQGPQVVQVAFQVGIEEVAVYRVEAPRAKARQEIVSAEVATPVAQAFVDAVLAAPFYDPQTTRITCRTVLAIVAPTPHAPLTQPMRQPLPVVLDELWQHSHITPSFVARALVAAALLAYGMHQNQPVTIMTALLFTPFLPLVLALSFGLWAGDRALLWQGAMALLCSTAMAVVAGAVVGWEMGGPIRFTDFKPLVVSGAISAGIGWVAGLSSADDVGRHYLIAVAAAAQYAIYPVWVGLSLTLGFPDGATTLARLGALGLNVSLIGFMALLTYAKLLGRRAP